MTLFGHGTDLNKTDMPYIVKEGNKNVLDEKFSTSTQARQAKYQMIIGAKNFKSASKHLDAKIVKVAKAKKK